MREEPKAAQGAISAELQELGRRLRRMAEALQESEGTRGLREELESGLQELRSEVDEILKSPELQRVGAQVRQVVETASPEIRRGLLAALKELNTHIEDIIERVEEEGKEGK